MNRPAIPLVTMLALLLAAHLLAAPAALAKNGKNAGPHGGRYEHSAPDDGDDRAYGKGGDHGRAAGDGGRNRASDAAIERWWQELPQAEQQRLLKDYARYRTLDPERRDRVRDRWQRFRDLPAEQQEQLRKHYRRWQELPPGQQERLQRTWRRYRDLPAGQQERLKQELRELRELPEAERERRRQELHRRYFPDLPPGLPR